MKRITIQDVAKQAGVSSATVSRALNSPEQVNQKTKRQVEAAVTKLGYSPNPSARSLSVGLPQSIGVVSVGSALSAPASIMKAISIEAQKHGISVTIGAYETQISDTEKLNQEINHLLENMYRSGISAIVCIQTYENSAQILYDRHFRVPAFYVINDSKEQVKALSSVRHRKHKHHNYFITIDQKEGVNQILDSVKDKGYKKVIFIDGPKDSLDAQLRRRAVKKTCLKKNLTLDIIKADSWYAKPGFSGVVEYFSEPHKRKELKEKKTAIFAANDLLAIGALRALNELRIAIPDEVGLVGFDNIDGTDFLVPSLTTADQPFDELGKEVVRSIIKLLDGKKVENKQIKPTLIERESL